MKGFENFANDNKANKKNYQAFKDLIKYTVHFLYNALFGSIGRGHVIPVCETCYEETFTKELPGVQWLSSRVLDLRPRGRGLEPYRHSCVVSLSKTH